MLKLDTNIAIDMGTSTTLLFEQGKGLAAREPTVVVVDRQTAKVQKFGQEAQKMLGRTPAKIAAIQPVQSGVISDYELAVQFLQFLVQRVTSTSLLKPNILACVPSSITGVEERAVIDAAIEAGARKVYLLEMAEATALGAGVDISKCDGQMVIDIGGGTTEVAVVSASGVVRCESIKTAGASFDEAIVKFIRDKYSMCIDLNMAEELKRSIGCVIPRPDNGMEEIKGSNVVNGCPKTISVNSTELIEAFVEPMRHILNAVQRVIERTPPSLIGDLDTNGIIMSGGGSLIYGINSLIERHTGIHTVVVDDPISCAAYGAGKMLSHLDEMDDGMLNISRWRSLMYNG